MKKLERRAFLCLLMAAALLAGLIFFIARLEINGAKWSAFYANRHVYTNGMLRVGSVSDRGGKLLLFTSPWNVDWATDHNPDLILSEFGNVAF